MEHLTIETLARLVDDAPDRGERAHLEACATCRAEWAALKEQTRALASLPGLLPPRGDWGVLEARLRSEGLLRDAGLLARLGLARTPGWMRVAASVLLFGLGALSGAGWSQQSPASLASGGAPAHSVDEAVAAVQAAERNYVEAMAQYRTLLANTGIDLDTADPLSRFAALEHLVMVSQAAVRQAPGDPFLNGFLASALAERDAAARLVSSSSGGWF